MTLKYLCASCNSEFAEADGISESLLDPKKMFICPHCGASLAVYRRTIVRLLRISGVLFFMSAPLVQFLDAFSIVSSPMHLGRLLLMLGLSLVLLTMFEPDEVRKASVVHSKN